MITNFSKKTMVAVLLFFGVISFNTSAITLPKAENFDSGQLQKQFCFKAVKDENGCSYYETYYKLPNGEQCEGKGKNFLLNSNFFHPEKMRSDRQRFREVLEQTAPEFVERFDMMTQFDIDCLGDEIEFGEPENEFYKISTKFFSKEEFEKFKIVVGEFQKSEFSEKLKSKSSSVFQKFNKLSHAAIKDLNKEIRSFLKNKEYKVPEIFSREEFIELAQTENEIDVEYSLPCEALNEKFQVEAIEFDSIQKMAEYIGIEMSEKECIQRIESLHQELKRVKFI